jgi:DNA-binding XRE family transcriptional regulator
MTPSDVKTLRRRLGWTQRQLAEGLGVTVPTVSHWEQGANGISPLAATTLGLLAKEHGVDPNRRHPKMARSTLHVRRRRGGRPGAMRSKPWYVQYREPDGRQKSPGFATKAEAEAWIRQHGAAILARRATARVTRSAGLPFYVEYRHADGTWMYGRFRTAREAWQWLKQAEEPYAPGLAAWSDPLPRQQAS